MESLLPLDNFCCGLIAPRRSGKTYTLVKLLANCKGRFDEIYLIYPKYNRSDNPYKNLGLNKRRIFTEYSNELLEAIKNRQLKKLREHSDYKSLIVIDDGLTEDEFITMGKSHILNKIANGGRHDGLSLILTSQTYSGLSTTLRNNLEYIFLYYMQGNNFEGVVNQFSNKRNRKEFEKALEKYTYRPYSFFYIMKHERKYFSFDPIKNSIDRIYFEIDNELKELNKIDKIDNSEIDKLKKEINEIDLELNKITDN